jgi:hypothetical protein
MLGFVWAKGGFLLNTFPQDYGYPYGIGGGFFFDTFILQMHYINNDLDGGVVDTSGVVFSVTSTLRKYNLSTLTVGSTASWQSIALVGTFLLKIVFK